MKKLLVAASMAIGVFICGCAQTLPPHEGINQAFKKSFEATGLNYSSKSRVNNISIPEKSAFANLSGNRSKYLGSGINIIRGLYVNTDGAIDMKSRKSEVLYDLHYDKDNVEISFKLPLLVDYNTQTIYVGTSFLNTVLEILYPEFPATPNGLMRININEILKDNSIGSKELSILLGDNRFSSKNLDSMSNAFKKGTLKSLARLNDSCFSELPLTELDKKTGIERRIHIILGHKDSVSVLLDLIDGISQNLYQDQIISKEEYAIMMTLTDKQKLESLIDQFSMTMILNIGISPSGFIGYMDSQINLSDKEGAYKLGLNNVSSFSNYNSPRFSIFPENSKITDFKQVLEAIKADKAKKQSTQQQSGIEEPE